MELRRVSVLLLCFGWMLPGLALAEEGDEMRAVEALEDKYAKRLADAEVRQQKETRELRLPDGAAIDPHTSQGKAAG